jgi:TM2 domain-containing membrane protein YozV
MPSKHPMTALLLSFIPGLGHLYLGRVIRGLLYGAGFFGPLLLVILLVFSGYGRYMYREPILILLVFAFLIAAINLLDMIVTIVNGRHPFAANQAGSISTNNGPAEGIAQSPNPNPIPNPNPNPYPANSKQGPDSFAEWQLLGNDKERFFTILLSFIPGLGHLQLGMMQRGLAFLVAFFGAFTMILFVASISSSDRAFVFLGVLPIIWLYAMFDCIQQLNRKRRGEKLIDQTFLEDFQEVREDGKKSKVIATFLSVVPGAGHMYIGLQKRGLQLMIAFFGCIYVLDVLHLSLFFFLIPILWFYSFFDALQLISKQGREQVQDIPLMDWLVHHQRWIGIALLGLGLYYVTDGLLLRLLDILFPQEKISVYFHRYFQTIVVSVVLVGSGLWMLAGSFRKKRGFHR